MDEAIALLPSEQVWCEDMARLSGRGVEFAADLPQLLPSFTAFLCSSLRAVCRKRELIISALSSKLPPSSFDISSRLLKKSREEKNKKITLSQESV